ncbi:MAG TPA: helix-turn-helix transcriptional regulator [Stenotrophobium sp.]|nr:helix-turn-helix transcriptional regulator [Stenotrophobium sp.]
MPASISRTRRITTPAKDPGSSLLQAGGLAGFADLNRLFSAIYEGPTETPPWQSSLQLLQKALAATHVTLILRPPSPESAGVMVNTDSAAADATASYLSHFFALDPFVGLPAGQILSPEEIVGSKWTQTVLYREYLRPLDVEHLIGADIHTLEGIECRFRVSRARGAPPFTAEDKALCGFLLPHLKRSIHLHARLDNLECERHLFAGVVNRLQMGVISYARDGSILDMNPEASRILAERDGASLDGNSLCIDSMRERNEFRRLLNEVLSGTRIATGPGLVEAMSITRPSGRSMLGVVVRSIPQGPWLDGSSRPVAAVFIRDPAASSGQSSQEITKQLFGLTQTESALATKLAEGLTLEEAAEQLGITKNTARTYLRFIFSKTGVSRQAMLIRKLLNSVATQA